MLQLDFQKKPRNMLQDESLVRGEKSKYPWFMMLVCLEDCRMLLDFFRNHVTFIKGVKVLLANLEDVEELAPIENSDASSPDFN